MKSGQKRRARHEGRPEKRSPAGGPGFVDEARRTGETPQAKCSAIHAPEHLRALLAGAPPGGVRVVAVFDAAGRIGDLALLSVAGRDPVAVPALPALRAAAKAARGAQAVTAQRLVAQYLAERAGLEGSA